MTSTTLIIQAAGTDTPIQETALAFRNFVKSIWPQEGVLGTGHLKVTQRATGANMTVDVAAGSCTVYCDTIANGGAYHIREDALTNVTIPGAPGSGTRTHLIVEQARDKQSQGSDPDYNSKPICVQDTGSGATLPPSALLLATVTVSAGQASVLNANITDLRVQAAGQPPSASGPFSGTTSGAGRIQIAHGMDVRPSTAFVMLSSAGNSYKEYVVSIASDVITVEFRALDTGDIASSGQAVAGYWHADR